MAKSFDELAKATMTEADIDRSEVRAREIIADLFLRDVRKASGLSQTELAVRMGIKQPSLSKLESQLQDMQVASLRQFVHAIGGTLDVIARFPKGSARLAGISDPGPNAAG